MSYDLFTAEQEAIKSLIELIDQANKCKQLHERANLALPEPLRRMLGLSSNGHKKAVATVPPPERPPLPIGAGSDWVSISIKSAYPTSIVLALLRDAGEPLAARDVAASVTALRPDIARGSVYNIGPRLDGDLINRSENGWELVDPEVAPILQDGLIWGRADMFNKQELAAHRRDAILHILRTVRSGLLTSQLIEFLQNCPWVHAPVVKELVQDDVELLSKEGKIKRRSNTKKWDVVEG